MTDSPRQASPSTWLLRISPAFAGVSAELLEALECRPVKSLGRDFVLVRAARAERLESEAAAFLGWRMPVDHSWPCLPRETVGFVEKAAQALGKKFGACGIQSVVAGTLDPSEPDRYHSRLASNLRGRALQVFGGGLVREAEAQNPESPTLFALVGREGLFCGLIPPREAGGFHAGGFKFIRQNHDDHVSRAGAKIAEALHFLTLRQAVPQAGAHWLELGASPGGMTSELLARGYRVTAVDRAPLNERLRGAEGLTAITGDVGGFRPPAGTPYQAMLSDMNGDPAVSMEALIRYAGCLQAGGLVVFTLKLPQSDDFPAMLRALETCTRMALDAGWTRIAATHLGHNRHELTLLLRSPGAVR
jgi:23S rRNA (cytidine2498-2'-O)-methyltransferase